MCERGQLDNKSKSELRKAGVVVVEVDDPAKCQFIRATETVGADDMLWAAMDALRVTDKEYGESKGHTQRARLAHNLIELVIAQKTARDQT